VVTRPLWQCEFSFLSFFFLCLLHFYHLSSNCHHLFLNPAVASFPVHLFALVLCNPSLLHMAALDVFRMQLWVRHSSVQTVNGFSLPLQYGFKPVNILAGASSHPILTVTIQYRHCFHSHLMHQWAQWSEVMCHTTGKWGRRIWTWIFWLRVFSVPQLPPSSVRDVIWP
jgi:hypothetical protein